MGLCFFSQALDEVQCRESRKHHQAKSPTHQWQVANWWSATPHGCSSSMLDLSLVTLVLSYFLIFISVWSFVFLKSCIFNLNLHANIIVSIACFLWSDLFSFRFFRFNIIRGHLFSPSNVSSCMRSCHEDMRCSLQVPFSYYMTMVASFLVRFSRVWPF